MTSWLLSRSIVVLRDVCTVVVDDDDANMLAIAASECVADRFTSFSVSTTVTRRLPLSQQDAAYTMFWLDDPVIFLPPTTTDGACIVIRKLFLKHIWDLYMSEPTGQYHCVHSTRYDNDCSNDIFVAVAVVSNNELLNSNKMRYCKVRQNYVKNSCTADMMWYRVRHTPSHRSVSSKMCHKYPLPAPEMNHCVINNNYHTLRVEGTKKRKFFRVTPSQCTTCGF